MNASEPRLNLTEALPAAQLMSQGRAVVRDRLQQRSWKQAVGLRAAEFIPGASDTSSASDDRMIRDVIACH